MSEKSLVLCMITVPPLKLLAEVEAGFKWNERGLVLLLWEDWFFRLSDVSAKKKKEH